MLEKPETGEMALRLVCRDASHWAGASIRLARTGKLQLHAFALRQAAFSPLAALDQTRRPPRPGGPRHGAFQSRRGKTSDGRCGRKSEALRQAQTLPGLPIRWRPQ